MQYFSIRAGLGVGLCAVVLLSGSVALGADADNDGIDDNVDNCTLAANADQRDTDGDDYGNACDPDFDNDGAVTFSDLASIKAVFLDAGDLDQDIDGDGVVTFGDLAVVKANFLGAPGPSGAVELADLAITTTRVYPALSFSLGLGLMQAPGDSSRWYVLEQQGFVRVFDNDPDVQSAATFLNIQSIAECCFEGGLLGMAFHPDYPTDPRVYVSYTREGPSGLVPLVSIVSEFRSTDGGLTLDVGTEQLILAQGQPYSNHNGGQITFGPDGYLYFALGDGGDGGDPRDNGQDTNTRLGAMLRIDVSVSPLDRDDGLTYDIPPDNPFATSTSCATGCPEIFAWGLRNTWKYSFDRDTGDLWAGDVGQWSFEEIDVIVKGGNYGWNCYEGDAAFSLSGCTDPSDYEFPVTTYGRSLGGSVTGGYVYRGSVQPGLVGVYFFADYLTGRIWAVNSATRKALGPPLVDTTQSISAFGESADGELYYLNYSGGIYRIDDAS